MSLDSSDTERTMDPDGVTTSSLEALQTGEHRKLLDIVDDLRRQGLSGIIELPQIVVCGDQSSGKFSSNITKRTANKCTGKSSILEAITEIPFPRNENLCTRFATEIILRRESRSSISIRITPDKDRSDHEQKALKQFRRTITDFMQLPDVMNEATKAIGLEEIGQNNRAFSRDVLTVEISGPT